MSWSAAHWCNYIALGSLKGNFALDDQVLHKANIWMAKWITLSAEEFMSATLLQ